MRNIGLLALVSFILLSACKSTEDYLGDLRNSQDSEGRLNLGVYDSGLLLHEAFAGIMEQDVLTLSQMGRAVHDAGFLLEKNEVALIRADAISVLSHCALRYPLPPLTTPFDKDRTASDAIEQISALERAVGPLDIGTQLELVESPDRAISERAHARLKDLSGESFPRLRQPWADWWEARRPAIVADIDAKVQEPLAKLTYLKYTNLSSARAVLGYLATWLTLYDPKTLRVEMTTAVTRLARQVVVFGIARGFDDPEPSVRSAAYRASQAVLDPSFAAALPARFQKERGSPDSMIHLLQTLPYYPSKNTLAALLIAIREENRAMNITAHRALLQLCGVDLGLDPEPWMIWYDREGKNRWP